MYRRTVKQLEFSANYSNNLPKRGLEPASFPLWMALAVCSIKERLGRTDDACVKQIKASPYLQYFRGLKKFTAEQPFHRPMFVYFTIRSHIQPT